MILTSGRRKKGGRKKEEISRNLGQKYGNLVDTWSSVMTAKRFLREFYGKNPFCVRFHGHKNHPQNCGFCPNFARFWKHPPKIYNPTMIMPKVWKFPMTASPPPKSSKMRAKPFKIHP